jgi:hypothetical protein
MLDHELFSFVDTADGARKARLRSGLSQPPLEPGRQKRLEPRGNAAIMLEPPAQMLGAAQSAGPSQALGAAMGPPAHHVIGHFRVELQADRMPAIAIRLVGELRPARGQEFGAPGRSKPSVCHW